jgi:hypothetical protein
MYQQFAKQEVHTSTNRFFRIYDSVQKWISKEIIDFDPFDDEVMVTQELIEQFRQTQLTIKA